MNKHLPYNILLGLAVIACGMAVFCNFWLRDSFPVIVQYTLPDPVTVREESVSSPQRLYGDDEQEEPQYLYDDYAESRPEPVVVVSFPLEINSASIEELMYIPRIGSVMAQRIVSYRIEMGSFTDLEQLLEISGIGQATFEAIEPYLYIEGQWSPEEEE